MKIAYQTHGANSLLEKRSKSNSFSELSSSSFLASVSDPLSDHVGDGAASIEGESRRHPRLHGDNETQTLGQPEHSRSAAERAAGEARPGGIPQELELW